MVGTAAYLHIDALRRLLGEQALLTLAAATVLAAALASALAVRRSLDRIDLLAVLKAKD